MDTATTDLGEETNPMERGIQPTAAGDELASAALRAWVLLTDDPAAWRGERGATMAEYGLLLGFVAVVVFGGLALFGPAVLDLFTDTHEEFVNRGAPATP